jgi:hypothetical protein
VLVTEHVVPFEASRAARIEMDLGPIDWRPELINLFTSGNAGQVRKPYLANEWSVFRVPIDFDEEYARAVGKHR